MVEAEKRAVCVVCATRGCEFTRRGSVAAAAVTLAAAVALLLLIAVVSLVRGWEPVDGG